MTFSIFRKLFNRGEEHNELLVDAKSSNALKEKHIILTESRTGKKLAAELSNDFLGIYELNYYGEFHRSENGRFILSWSDASPDGMQGGAREKGLGRYFLIDEDKIIFRGNLERPNEGKVSDKGAFVINDWMFGDYVGTFYAFDVNGQRLVKHKFNANLWGNGISRDGQFAVCQTCASDNRDNNKLSFFDLGKRELVWKVEPEVGLADRYGFDIEKGILYLSFKDGATYRYGFNGTFLDSEKWEKDESERWQKEKTKSPIESRYGYGLYELATQKLTELGDKEVDISSCDEAISLMKQAIEKGVSQNYEAMIHRRLGELYQKHGCIPEAISHYERAISLYPKAGVKKVLDSLKEAQSKQ